MNATPCHPLVRWLKFNAVGGLGIVMQLAMLTLLDSVLNLNYLVATALAVQAAVLHNFFWHERFTWADRRSVTWIQVGARFLRFNLSNGLISIAGNLLLMRLFAGHLHLPYPIASVLSIACCALLNFVAAERLVFPKSGELVPPGCCR